MLLIVMVMCCLCVCVTKSFKTTVFSGFVYDVIENVKFDNDNNEKTIVHIVYYKNIVNKLNYLVYFTSKQRKRFDIRFLVSRCRIFYEFFELSTRCHDSHPYIGKIHNINPYKLALDWYGNCNANRAANVVPRILL